MMMGQINFQFHITPEELLVFLYKIAEEHGLVVILEKYHPPSKKLVKTSSNLAQSWRKMRQVDVVYIYNGIEAANAERDPLIVNAGMRSRSELRETQWGGRTDSPSLSKFWRKLTSRLKRQLPERGFVYSSSTGLFSDKPSRFLSQGAAAASCDSKIRLSLIGSNEVRVNKN
jgi:hypothetical protein